MKKYLLNKINGLLWSFMLHFGLVKCINNDIDSIYDQMSLESADQPIRRKINPAGRMVTNRRALLVGNPKSVAQFDINVSITSRNSGVATFTPTVLLPTLLFGQADYEGNYRKGLGLNPLPANIQYAGALTYPNIPAAWGITNVVGAQIGDLVLYFTQLSTTSHFAVIINCPQVAYSTLLAATNSDTFVTNLIRYSLPSPTVLGQYSNPVNIFKQSLFGKTENDSLNPLSYKNPNQQQTNIIDIPVAIAINKRTEIGIYVQTTPTDDSLGVNVALFSWSVFVESDRKI